MAASMEPYEKWLEDKLLSLNPDVDTEIFVSYITGILDTDTSLEDKKESLSDIIGQVVEDNQESVCEELLKHWQDTCGNGSSNIPEQERLTEHLSHILEQQKIDSVKTKEKTSEDRERKEAILAQYQNMSDGEDNGDEKAGDAGSGGDLLGYRNTNKEAVQIAIKETREKSKMESDKKKEKDKQDREAQKQKQKERKEAEKKRTQKGEKRR